MSEEFNQVNKSIQELEKEKLQAEIDILKARLAKEYPEITEEKPGWFERASNYAGKWSALILGAVTLISAIWGVFLPLSEYLVEQRKALEYELNENMIGFVDDLNSDSAAIANRGVMMLSYYETNSIPILLFFLEGSRNEQEVFRDKIIETIGLIYEDSKASGIMDVILIKLENSFAEIEKDYFDSTTGIDGADRRALFNYMDLVNGMNLRSGDKADIEDLYRGMKSKICMDENFQIEVFGIFSQICIYLNEDMTCD
jgi:hypothetical protein